MFFSLVTKKRSGNGARKTLLSVQGSAGRDCWRKGDKSGSKEVRRSGSQEVRKSGVRGSGGDVHDLQFDNIDNFVNQLIQVVMKILVTGSNGQLGQELRQLSRKFPVYEFIFTDILELDITNRHNVEQFFADHKPEAVINCAGYTAVDKAETDSSLAFELNGASVGHLALNASKAGAIFVHISTDYVYDLNKTMPYVEEDTPNPQSVYAKSKYNGELEALKYASGGIVFRTSWLYSEFMHNFVKTIISKGAERRHLNVVYDQVGTPTYARDLASAILTILPSLKNQNGVEIYNYSNEGVVSWYDFAKAVVEFSGIKCKISPILTEQYPLPAPRPAYSVMNKAKFKQKFGIEIPYWRDSLKECVERIMNYG
jgi:dTDP-4-dehydrorhamnose reductase